MALLGFRRGLITPRLATPMLSWESAIDASLFLESWSPLAAQVIAATYKAETVQVYMGKQRDQVEKGLGANVVKTHTTLCQQLQSHPLR